MVVCIDADLGLYFRINTRGNYQVPVKLERARHPFLDHDSYLECGDPLELDDYVIEEGMRSHRGLVGRVDCVVVPLVWDAARKAQTIAPRDKAAIFAALSSACPDCALPPP